MIQNRTRIVMDARHEIESSIAARARLADTLAREAGEIARRHRAAPGGLAVEAKGPQDWVTEADRAVERHIRERLREAFPEDAMIGEEDGGEAREAVWIVDPIDGTSNYLRGLPEYAVSIAFRRGQHTELGIVYQPDLDRCFAAVRGHGAHVDDRPIQVRSTTQHVGEAVLTIGHHPSCDRATFLRVLTRFLEAGAEFRRFGSAALGLASVAAGQVDAFWQMRLNAWDVAAGLLLVTEAGGVTNRFYADDGLTRGNATLATHARLAGPLSSYTGIDLEPT